MEYIKVIISFILLFTVGMRVAQAEIEINKYGIERMVYSLEEMKSEFEFYNIKATGRISSNISEKEMYEICMNIADDIKLENDELTIEENWNDYDKNVCIYLKNNYSSTSITVIKKNDEESYILVDILNNKVYKDIVDKYAAIDRAMDKHVENMDINVCICTEYNGNLFLKKNDEIFREILYNMRAKEVGMIEDKNFISMTAYSKSIENTLEVLGKSVNLNIGMRYSEYEDKTYLYIATPIIKLDY